VYIEKPGYNNVIVEGVSTESTSITDALDRLTVSSGAIVAFDSSVTIGELLSEEDAETTDVCKVIVPDGTTLTATAMGMVVSDGGRHNKS